MDQEDDVLWQVQNRCDEREACDEEDDGPEDEFLNRRKDIDPKCDFELVLLELEPVTQGLERRRAGE